MLKRRDLCLWRCKRMKSIIKIVSWSFDFEIHISILRRDRLKRLVSDLFDNVNVIWFRMEFLWNVIIRTQKLILYTCRLIKSIARVRYVVYLIQKYIYHQRRENIPETIFQIFKPKHKFEAKRESIFTFLRGNN